MSAEKPTRIEALGLALLSMEMVSDILPDVSKEDTAPAMAVIKQMIDNMEKRKQKELDWKLEITRKLANGEYDELQ